MVEYEVYAKHDTIEYFFTISLSTHLHIFLSSKYPISSMAEQKGAPDYANVSLIEWIYFSVGIFVYKFAFSVGKVYNFFKPLQDEPL